MSTLDPPASPDDPSVHGADHASPARSGIWWPLALVFVGAAITFLVLWFGGLLDNAQRNLAVQCLGLLTGGLVAFWGLLLSPLSNRGRLGLLGLILAAAALFLATVRVEGFHGDLWLDLSWRWSDPRHTGAPARPMGKANYVRQADLVHVTPYDFAQFLGPDRTASVNAVNLEPDWEKHPPEPCWQKSLGTGWSAFSIVGNYAVTQDQFDGRERVVCFHLPSGDVCWEYIDTEAPAYESVVAGDGPRATPTIYQGRVYAIGATGHLHCLDGATGKPIWSVKMFDKPQVQNNHWGTSCSPLVFDDRVVVNCGHDPGELVIAYDAKDGTRLWASGNDSASYASPILATLDGQRQVVSMNRKSVVGLDPDDGRILWVHPWPNPEPNVANPLLVGEDRLFFTSGYGFGCAVCKITKGSDKTWQVEERWHNKNLKAKFTNVVTRDGYVYGLDDGILTCIEVESGKRMWKKGRYNHGQILLVDDLILVQAESGELVLVEANPKKHHELGRAAALADKTWNNPALAGPYLLVRNDRESRCFRLALRDKAPAQESTSTASAKAPLEPAANPPK